MKNSKLSFNTHLLNLLIFGIVPAVILYLISQNDHEFADNLKGLIAPAPLVLYFAALFMVSVAISWAGYWVVLISRFGSKFISSAHSTLRSIYYVISGVNLTGSLVLFVKMNDSSDFVLAIMGILAGVLYFVFAVFMVNLLPPALRSE